MKARIGTKGRLGRAAVSVLVSMALATTAHAFGRPLVVSVPEPFEIGGRTYPAGLLSLRHVGSFTPGTTIDEVTVGGRCLGIMIAQRQQVGPFRGSAAVFVRNESGRLALVGYRVVDRDRGRLYVFRAGRGQALPAASNGIVLVSGRRSILG